MIKYSPFLRSCPGLATVEIDNLGCRQNLPDAARVAPQSAHIDDGSVHSRREIRTLHASSSRRAPYQVTALHARSRSSQHGSTSLADAGCADVAGSMHESKEDLSEEVRCMALSVGNRHSAGGHTAMCRPPGHGAAGWPGVAPEGHGLSSHSRRRPGRVALELYFSVRGPARSPRAALRAAC